MDGKMNEEQRQRLKEFLDANPDALPTARVASMGAYDARDILLQRIMNVLYSVPPETLAQPQVYISLTGYLHALFELETLLETGTVDGEDAARRTSELVQATMMPIIERFQNDD